MTIKDWKLMKIYKELLLNYKKGNKMKIKNWEIIQVRFGFNKKKVWIGCDWNKPLHYLLNIYICIIPCFPIYIELIKD